MTFIIEWIYKNITDERYDVTLIFVYGIRAKVKTHRYKNTPKPDDIFFIYSDFITWTMKNDFVFKFQSYDIQKLKIII